MEVQLEMEILNIRLTCFNPIVWKASAAYAFIRAKSDVSDTLHSLTRSPASSVYLHQGVPYTSHHPQHQHRAISQCGSDRFPRPDTSRGWWSGFAWPSGSWHRFRENWWEAENKVWRETVNSLVDKRTLPFALLEPDALLIWVWRVLFYLQRPSSLSARRPSVIVLRRKTPTLCWEVDAKETLAHIVHSVWHICTVQDLSLTLPLTGVTVVKQ